MLEKRWNQKLSWAIVTLQRNLRGLINRRRFQVFQKKVTVIQAYFRGHLARKRYQRLKKTLVQFRVAMLISRPLIHRRRHYYQRFENWQRNESLIRGAEEHRRYLEMDVRRLEIPAELAALLRLAEGHQRSRMHQVTEVSLPEVKARTDHSLPSDINNFPFSMFMRSHFQEMIMPALGQPLQQPLTRLNAEQKQIALQLNKLILRFINDKELESWQEEVLGNYIASRGLGSPSLRNEVLCQVATQVWKNPDLEQGQRGWVLMAVLLGSFTPSPALEKPLLKFVSDFGLEGYNGMCQHKLLMSMKEMESDPEVSRSFPPTQLEWTTNRRRGRMMLDVYTYKEERLSAEVESWTTGEQYAGWILSSRGLETVPRGWSVSMFTDQVWHDLPGCDFVLDLIGQIEESNWPSDSTPEYPITPEWDKSSFKHKASDRTFLNIPPAPNIKAPSFPPPSLPPDFDSSAHSGSTTSSRSMRELDYYVDDLFRPLSRAHLSDMENEGSLTERMKGGGQIGPNRQAGFPGYSGMMTVPGYPSVPVMGGMMPTTMPVMPGLGGMGAMPAMVMPQPQPVVPSVDPNQMAAQQQAFINQQALLLAQQMTLQAMTISQQQRERQDLQRERSLEPSRPRRSSSWKRSPEFRRSRRASPPSSPEFPRPRRASPKRRSPDSSRPRYASPQRRSPELSRARQGAPRQRSPEESSRTRRTASQEHFPESSGQRQNSNFTNKDVSVPDLPASPLKPPAPIQIFKEELYPDVKADSLSKGSFQKKVEFFQKIGQHVETPAKKETPPSNKWSRPKPLQPEEQERPQTASSEPSSGLTPPTQKKTEPTHEIRSIVQTRPLPPPKPDKPLRNVSKPFVKKKDPKEEALAKLGMVGLSPSPLPSASPERNSPPPQGPPAKLSSSIKEKQLPLMNLFARPSPIYPPASASELPPPTAPLLPPPPPSFPSEKTTVEKTSLKGSGRTMVDDAHVKTQLINLSPSVSFSYVNPSWKLFLRKEVFYPKENFSHPYCLNLLCDQIIRDTYSESCVRISREERRKMKDLLMGFKVGLDASSIPEDGIKKRIVVAARDNWANYFSRFFPVKGENGSDVQILGVSHRGLQLLKKEKAANFSPEHLKILCSYSYADVLSLELMGRNTLQFSLKSEQLTLISPKACQIKVMVELFLRELKQDSNYVVALRSYITDDKSLLSFKRGDFIRLMPMEGLEQGWQFGSIGGRSGLFPSGLVQVVAAPDYLNLCVNRQEEVRKSLRKNRKESISSKENSASSMVSEIIDTSTTTNTPDTCRYTMAEFATAHFRDAQLMLGLKGMNNAGQKNPAVLVQHTKVPIQGSLLFYSDDEMNDLATKTFLTVMRFMGDQPSIKKHHEVDYIYEILQLCKEKKSLHDEVYCQVIKQITKNPQQDSCHRGWQLLSLLTGYFPPSTTLMPYVTKYLQQVGADSSSLWQELAWTCQRNLRKIIQNGGRRHLPSPIEMAAFLKGHISRRILVNLPGDQGYSTKIKTFTLAEDLLKEITELMGVVEPEEIQEFALLVSRDDGKMARPLHHRDYIHDYVIEDNSVVLNFCRMTWKIPLHFENENYINIHYNQVLQNYMTGKLLLHDTGRLQELVGTLAVFQHWAKGAASTPSMQELINYIPAPVAHLISLEIIQTSVSYQLKHGKHLQQQEAKINFIEHMVQLPLFDYNMYPVERMSISGLPMPCFVGVNQEQIIVVDEKFQKLHCQIPLREICYMRTLRLLDEFGSPGLEVNYGSAEDPKTIWFELKQAKELYHTIAIIIAKEARESVV
ncbi:unconventional myosin-XVB [Pogona vitticeps]